MKTKPIIIIAGEPYSIFLEIFFKTLKSTIVKKNKFPIILIASKKIVMTQMKKLGFNFKIKTIHENTIKKIYLSNNVINLIDVEFKSKKVFDKISSKSKKYIEKSFKIGIKLMNEKKGLVLINGPISKINFLNNKYPGVTEYIADKVNKKGKEVMLIYNKALSVSPITTHLPLKNVFKYLSIKQIVLKIQVIDKFFKKTLKRKSRIAITGLNPHCESLNKNNEEKKIIIPAIKLLKKRKININGPYPADTIFLKKNRIKFDVVVGMYHDQVLTPIKTLFEFNAINITLGLPFIRITPDHGPNHIMLGKNKSNPSSLIETLKFIKNFSAS